MPHSFGYRAHTRHLFAKEFRKHGAPGLSTYMQVYKLGDYVDIKANGAIHKGMPFKYYHGRTGRVWNVSKRAIGVEVDKRVGHRFIRKRIHVRVEHVKPSRCQVDFIARRKRNEALKCYWSHHPEAIRFNLKRLPEQPRKARLVKTKNLVVETLSPLKYTEVY
eukprot:TRINITY_DN5788_c1_g1_i1.p2 TRINITY_DN5788_c1_g1~~TRINITY_DN5788_c1_g1_i1.p2  ORF type:complete len:163 (-),score=47.50 TRINITY_DN5788_c1_g1_i1:115-603(-)